MKIDTNPRTASDNINFIGNLGTPLSIGPHPCKRYSKNRPKQAVRFFLLLFFLVLICPTEVRAITIDYPDKGKHRFSVDEKARIQAIACRTELEVRILLPDLPTDLVLVVRSGADVIPETGELGAALSYQKIGWTVDPAREGSVTNIITVHLRKTLYHEMHHLAHGWTMDNAFGFTIMDAVVSEGIATAFARDFAGAEVPWGQYPDDIKSWLSELVDLLPGARYDHWMFKHPDGRRWIGYRTGTYIADLAIKNSGGSAARLASLETKDILMLALPDGNWR